MKDCDAKFSKYEQCDPKVCKQMESVYGKESHVSVKHHSVNKLIFDVDANSYSPTFPSALKTGSAVLKISTFLEMGLVATKPWRHYIPVDMSLSNLQERIEWARNNDK